MAESEEELKSLLRMKEESERDGLKLNIQKTKIMASGPITSWQIDGVTVETVADFILGGTKITADGDCSHEIKKPWKKSYDQPKSVLKSRGTRDQIANICWIIKKAREFQKNICSIDYVKAFDCVDHNKL